MTTSAPHSHDHIYTIKPLFGLRHPVSGLLHLLGGLLGLGMLFQMTDHARDVHSERQLLAALIYGGGTVMLYLASSLYHLVDGSEKLTRIFRQLDHSMIYVFIASTYSPMFLVSFSQPFGDRVFLFTWALAIFGVFLRVFVKEGGPRKLRSALYLGMGWMILLVFSELWRTLGAGGFAWLLGGGMLYSLGAVVYARKRPDPIPEHFGFHEIWHLHVLLGSACHYWMVRRYVMGF